MTARRVCFPNQAGNLDFSPVSSVLQHTWVRQTQPRVWRGAGRQGGEAGAAASPSPACRDPGRGAECPCSFQHLLLHPSSLGELLEFQILPSQEKGRVPTLAFLQAPLLFWSVPGRMRRGESHKFPQVDFPQLQAALPVNPMELGALPVLPSTAKTAN